MIPLVIAAALAAAPPAQSAPLAEAAHALASGRIEQARIMIGNAVKAGADGPQLDRLLADLAFESGDYRLALARYEALLAASPGRRYLPNAAAFAPSTSVNWRWRSG
jgi:hypothetical protein